MPMFPQQPQMTSYAPQSFGMGMQGQMAPPPPMQPPMGPPMAPQMPMPQGAPQLPKIPKPGQLPVRGQQMSTNSTGGPSQGANSDLRAGVFTQLYRLGKQMDGKANMFGQYDPNMAPVEDPMAWMQPPPVEDPRVMPQLPPAPQAPTPDMYPPHLQQPQPMQQRPIDRFPRAAGMMGRQPMLPPGQRGY